MEISCSRCHRTVRADDCFCPTCGLPQLVFEGDSGQSGAQAERWNGDLRDAGVVEWKPALRAAVLFAVPAGLFSSSVSPVAGMGFLLMAFAAAWAVGVYVRLQRPAWITLGAGVRIGLVTGLMAAWLAFSVSGGELFVDRFVLHHGGQIDQEWKSLVDQSQQATQQWMSPATQNDEAQMQAMHGVLAFMMTPEGHAGWMTFRLGTNMLVLLLFSMGGGALGARLVARTRRPEV